MRGKTSFLVLGLVTLLVFPLPALWALEYFEDIHFLEVLELDNIFSPLTLIGLELGVIYAFIVISVGQLPAFETLSKQQRILIEQLNLNWGDIIFISFCAGFGEEILFRAGIQHWLGPWITSVLFIAVHGYFNPLSLKKSLHGFLILPFIILLAFAYEKFGLWFVVAAHFSYDLVLFSQVVTAKKPKRK